MQQFSFSSAAAHFTKDIFFLLFVGLLLFTTSCKTVDIRTDYALQNQAPSEYEKGKQLLEEAYFAMGYDKLKNVETYEVNSLFNWRMPWTMMPMNALPGNKGNELLFKFNPNTFDGQVTYLEGRKKGKTYGLQSWQGYVFEEGETPQLNDNKRYAWGLPTYHYIIEGPARLQGADIIRYAGEGVYNGKSYDLVYATWGQDAPHNEHDQWLIYINKETKMIDLTELTINDFFLSMPPSMKGGTVLYEREKTSNGAYLPSKVTIQLGTPKAPGKYVYAFDLTNYRFNSFAEKELYPMENLEKVGDTKIETK